mgnify:CR=1 FL=1
MAGAKEASSSSSYSSSRVFGNKYKLDRHVNAEDEESGSVSMDILGASSMELDPQVCWTHYRTIPAERLQSSLTLGGRVCTWQKLDEASDLDINTLELWLTAQKMLKLIMQSEKVLPQELRMLIRRIHDDVRLCLLVLQLCQD